jgi:hypothetical protein
VILRYDRDAESGREASIPASGHSKRPRSGLWSGPTGSTLSVRLGISAESPGYGPIDVGGDNRLDAATSHGAQSMPTPCRPAADECAPFHVSPSNHALYSEINIALYRRRRIKAGWNWSMTALGPMSVPGLGRVKTPFPEKSVRSQDRFGLRPRSRPSAAWFRRCS